MNSCWYHLDASYIHIVVDYLCYSLTPIINHRWDVALSPVDEPGAQTINMSNGEIPMFSRFWGPHFTKHWGISMSPSLGGRSRTSKLQLPPSPSSTIAQLPSPPQGCAPPPPTQGRPPRRSQLRWRPEIPSGSPRAAPSCYSWGSPARWKNQRCWHRAGASSAGILRRHRPKDLSWEELVRRFFGEIWLVNIGLRLVINLFFVFFSRWFVSSRCSVMMIIVIEIMVHNYRWLASD